MNKLDKDYTDLLQDILENGISKKDRTGTGTISVFGRQIRHSMKDGFPLLTTKKMYMKGIVTELLWILRGDTNIKYLVDNNCHIWDGDCYKSYEKAFNEGKVGGLSPMVKGVADEIIPKELFIDMIENCDELGSEEFAKKWGSLGKIYGFQWRSWGSEEILVEKSFGDEEGFGYKRKIKEQTKGVDQISELIKQLKENPDSRRLLVSAWNISDLPHQVLPACHYGFQVYTRELSLEERDVIFARRTFISTKGSFAEQSGTLADYLDKEGIPRRAISLSWNQRSVDTFLGLPFNIASYGLLLEIIAKAVNMVPDELIGNLGDVHLYSNHIDQALEQIGRELRVDERVCMCYENPSLDVSRLQEGMSDSEFTAICDEFGIPTRTRIPFELPSLKFGKTDEFFKSLGDDLSLIGHLDNTDFVIEGYQSHPTIKAPLSN